MPKITLHNITKRFKTRDGYRTVLDDVSISFPFGTNIGILGINGQGKTTLLNIIGGREYPDSGKVERQGSVSWPIGFSGALHGSLTGEGNIRFLSRIYKQDYREVYSFITSFADIGNYINMPVKTYSSGMRAKLAFAMSLSLSFDFYLVDEVTSVGDVFFRKKCKEEFDKRKERSTMIMVSHNIKTIKDYCETAYILHNGTLTPYDDMKQAIKAYRQLGEKKQ